MPPTLRHYLQRYSRELLGRQLTIEGARFNVFTGSITLRDLRLYEVNDSSVFIKVDEVFVNPAIWKMLRGTYELQHVAEIAPSIVVEQYGEAFNFDDLMARFTEAGTDTTALQPEEPVRYVVRNLKVAGGRFTYRNLDLPSEIMMEKVDISCPAISWNDPNMHFDFSMIFSEGGRATGAFEFNQQSLDFRADYRLESLFISVLFPYVRDFMKAGRFEG